MGASHKLFPLSLCIKCGCTSTQPVSWAGFFWAPLVRCLINCLFACRLLVQGRISFQRKCKYSHVSMNEGPSEKCIIRWFRCCANVTECAYTVLGGAACYTPRLYAVAIASGLQACTARYRTKQHEIKSSPRDSGTMKRWGRPERYEAAAGVTHGCFTANFCFYIRKSALKIRIKSIM